MQVDFHDFFRDIAINLVAIWLFAFVIYYRRYCDRQMAVTLGLFNLFIFTVIITMTFTDFDIASGFALFAMLSIISLRSVNISKVEVAYLFGAIALGLINGISFSDYRFLLLCNLTIITGALVFDSKWLIQRTVETKVTLENISAIDLKDEKMLRTRVEELQELPVLYMAIEKFNTNKKTVQLTVRLKL